MLIIVGPGNEFLQSAFLSLFTKNTVGAEVIPENRLGEKLGLELGEVAYLVGVDGQGSHYGTPAQIADILLLKAEGARVTLVTSILLDKLVEKTTALTGCPVVDLLDFAYQIGFEQMK